MSRYLVYRWFTDPAQRGLYPAEDHRHSGQGLHRGPPGGVHGGSRRAGPARSSTRCWQVSPEFAEVWRLHEVDVTHHHDLKRYRHPELGELELYCQRLVDPDQAQELLVFSAEPGSPSYEKLQLLTAAVG